ncbi:serine protease [uncultured Cytophaga sp.]|uniref:S1 family peptidase n=1 Tax=uncultured Cytophaga sp. TaxID=160238 RepID=UPI00261D4FCC|nr:serine protease [uncultured Cytophaga sp.]
MFVEAIDKVSNYTRPIHTIMRTYGGKQIIAGAATMFFVNNLGYAVTCKHVVDMLIASENINQQYAAFKAERDRLPNDSKYKSNLKGLELKYKFTPETVIQIKITFVDAVDQMSGFTMHLHPTLDLAILKLNDFKKVMYTDVAVFKKNGAEIKQGETMCRLGFPFPEFTNFRFNEAADDIEWTAEGVTHSPRFPIDGMVTRFLADPSGIVGIELSTPGLKGQSGGPLFNKSGYVCGMQSSTKHLHLGFDLIETEILINNKLKKVTDYSFIHLGQCVHVDQIKAFLDEHKIMYNEED